jgi:hypothetical protein
VAPPLIDSESRPHLESWTCPTTIFANFICTACYVPQKPTGI